jgi:hypothetical protein
MKLPLILFLLSFFFLLSLETKAPFDEFISFFNPPEFPEKINIESTSVKEAREKVDKIKEYFEKEFENLTDKFKNVQDDSIRLEKKVTESKILILLEYGRALLSKSLPKTLVNYEFSEIIYAVFGPYFESSMLSRSDINSEWHSRLTTACHEMLEVFVSIRILLPLEFKELLRLLDNAKADEELKKKLVEGIESVYLEKSEWSNDILQNIGNKSEIIKLKDTILEKYPKAHYDDKTRKSDSLLWFSHLRDTIKGSKADSSNDNFSQFSIAFMNLFLYRYLSKKDEEFLIDLFLTSTHKNDLLDIRRVKPLSKSRLFVNHCDDMYKRSERNIINLHLEENWRNKYTNLEAEGEKVMMEKFFPMTQVTQSEEPSSRGKILAIVFSVIAFILVIFGTIFLLRRKSGH